MLRCGRYKGCKTKCTSPRRRASPFRPCSSPICSWRPGRGWCGSPTSGRSRPASGGWRWRCRSSPSSRWRQGRGQPFPGWALIAAIALGGLFFAADLAAWHEGILRTKLANATLFGNFASFLFAIYGFILLRAPAAAGAGRRAAARRASARCCCSAAASSSRASHFTGDLLALLAGLFYTFYLIAVDRARRTMTPWPVLAIATAAGALPLLLFALALGEQVMPRRLDAGDPALDLAAS